MIDLRKRAGAGDHFHNSLNGIEHPDADVVRIGFNTDTEVFHKGSKIHHLPQGLNTAWGSTIHRAAENALKMLDYPSIYTQCPSCRHTQWDLDFEAALGQEKMQRCRLCGNQRALQ